MGEKASNGATARRTIKDWLGVLRHDPEPVVILVAAGTVAVLGATNVVADINTLLSATLAVLAVLGFSALRQARRRRTELDQFGDTTASLDQITRDLAVLRDSVAPATSIEELSPGPAIRKAFENAVATTDWWRFRGGTGSFTRAWTLPKLAERSRGNAGAAWVVQLQIIDPRDEALCRSYTDYRAKLASHRSETTQVTWTVERVRLECFATILAAHWYRQHEFLDVEVALNASFSTIRYDISATVAILTNEDRRFPALRAHDSGALYRVFRADFDRSFEGAPKLPRTSAVVLPRSADAITGDHIVSVLEASGVDPSVIDASLLQEIPGLALAREDPYALAAAGHPGLAAPTGDRATRA